MFIYFIYFSVPQAATKEADSVPVLTVSDTQSFYVCSLSSRTIVYKGQLAPEQVVRWWSGFWRDDRLYTAGPHHTHAPQMHYACVLGLPKYHAHLTFTYNTNVAGTTVSCLFCSSIYAIDGCRCCCCCCSCCYLLLLLFSTPYRLFALLCL